ARPLPPFAYSPIMLTSQRRRDRTDHGGARLLSGKGGDATLARADSACFAIADVSGYTNFVSGVELDHAQDIIVDTMDALVWAPGSPFRLTKFEGDALTPF